MSGLRFAPTALKETGLRLTINLSASNCIRDYGVVPGSLHVLPMYREQQRRQLVQSNTLKRGSR